MLQRIPRLTARRWAQIGGLAALALVLVAALMFRDEILRASLDPKAPFQTYRPPDAPDYAQRDAWVLLPADPAHWAAGDGPADVFFVHPTTYNGGEDWNGPIGHPRSARMLDQVMIPNYAGPFAKAGRLFAPRYRQASLYAMLSLREDARAARAFAYEDVRRAWRLYLDRYNQRRPVVLVGVEQGGSILARLLREEVARDPALQGRLVAAYLIQTVTPADTYGRGGVPAACAARAQARCVVAYAAIPRGAGGMGRRILRRALVWNGAGELEPLAGRAPLCVNPLLGAATTAPAPREANLGAANASQLEWGVRPAFLPRQVSAQCVEGLLQVSRPRSPSLKPAGGWADRLKAAPYNPFYLDLEADALARLKALRADPNARLPAPPITTSIEVRRARVMGR
ncbi:MAG: DUF3089 domain-containing protein [Caulobacteraceae bacterium]